MPWPVAGDLTGKILIDASNPVLPGLAGLAVGTTTSAAEMVAQWAAGARVVKAFNAVKADRSVVVVDVPSLADFAYQLNLTRPPFATKALRQAVAYALDLEQIVKGVWLNVGVPANGPIPPTS